jgi:hypothetical protein
MSSPPSTGSRRDDRMRLTLLLALLAPAAALATQPAADPLEGTWRGPSQCQYRPSACQDEIAVYHITRAAQPHKYLMVMNKVIGGEEQTMGDLVGTFDAASHTLTATSYDRQKRPGHWTLVLRGDQLSGRLVTSDGRLFRLITLSRIRS